MAETSNAERFIDAFNRIDQVLRSRAKQDLRKSTIAELIENSRDVVQQQKKKLQTMVKLRNVIVHELLDSSGEILAEPRKSAVDWLERQADVIEKPPIVSEVIDLVEPKVLDADDEIDAFLVQIAPPNNFSQSPFKDANGKFRLITTNAVARWVADNYEQRDGVIAGPSTVGEVFGNAELEDRLEERSSRLKCVDAVRAFSGEQGVPPAAILLTEPRGATLEPIGIVTRGDLPALYKALGV